MERRKKYIKRTLDILLKRQWLKTLKDNTENSTDIEENQKIKQKQIKSVENKTEQSISSNKE